MFEKLVAPITEEEITKHWKHTDKIYTSVICCTFNQDMYIRDAIDSFLAQVTKYKFEIIIHDDLSTDSTREILKQYQQKYPSIIKLILQDRNQFSINCNMPFMHSLAIAKGEYIAICEGDDFWINECKLQRQLVELERNKQVDLCFHSAFSFDGVVAALVTKYANINSDIKVESIIEKKYGQIATASSFVRREAMVDFIDYVNSRLWLTVGDIYIHFFSSKRGGAIYIDTPMSVYRTNAVGSWSQTMTNEKLVNHIIQEFNSYNELNELTQYNYASSFNKSNLKTLNTVLHLRKVPLKTRFVLCIKYGNYFNLSLKSLNTLLISSVPLYLDMYLFMRKVVIRKSASLFKKIVLLRF
jgi:glycosyltransferase involved in cell wall biosynthesis